MERRPEFGRQVARQVGELVAFYRQNPVVAGGKRITVQELADRCKGLGLPLTRPVISKLEGGIREMVTVEELQVLAMALGVPPVLLMFPLGLADAVEVLPGRPADPWAAIEWFTGNSEDPADPNAPPQMGTSNPVSLWAEHRLWDGEIPVIYRSLPDASMPPLPNEDAERHRLEMEVRALRRIREVMRETGLTPPPLHPETARILGEEEPDGQHR